MPWRSRDIADLATFPRGNAIVRERWQAYAHYRHLKRMATPAKAVIPSVGGPGAPLHRPRGMLSTDAKLRVERQNLFLVTYLTKLMTRRSEYAVPDDALYYPSSALRTTATVVQRRARARRRARAPAASDAAGVDEDETDAEDDAGGPAEKTSDEDGSARTAPDDAALLSAPVRGEAPPKRRRRAGSVRPLLLGTLPLRRQVQAEIARRNAALGRRIAGARSSVSSYHSSGRISGTLDKRADAQRRDRAAAARRAAEELSRADALLAPMQVRLRAAGLDNADSDGDGDGAHESPARPRGLVASMPPALGAPAAITDGAEDDTTVPARGRPRGRGTGGVYRGPGGVRVYRAVPQRFAALAPRVNSGVDHSGGSRTGAGADNPAANHAPHERKGQPSISVHAAAATAPSDNGDAEDFSDLLDPSARLPAPTAAAAAAAATATAAVAEAAEQSSAQAATLPSQWASPRRRSVPAAAEPLRQAPRVAVPPGGFRPRPPTVYFAAPAMPPPYVPAPRLRRGSAAAAAAITAAAADAETESTDQYVARVRRVADTYRRETLTLTAHQERVAAAVARTVGMLRRGPTRTQTRAQLTGEQSMGVDADADVEIGSEAGADTEAGVLTGPDLPSLDTDAPGDAAATGGNAAAVSAACGPARPAGAAGVASFAADGDVVYARAAPYGSRFSAPLAADSAAVFITGEPPRARPREPPASAARRVLAAERAADAAAQAARRREAVRCIAAGVSSGTVLTGRGRVSAPPLAPTARPRPTSAPRARRPLSSAAAGPEPVSTASLARELAAAQQLRADAEAYAARAAAAGAAARRGADPTRSGGGGALWEPSPMPATVTLSPRRPAKPQAGTELAADAVADASADTGAHAGVLAEAPLRPVARPVTAPPGRTVTAGSVLRAAAEAAPPTRLRGGRWPLPAPPAPGPGTVALMPTRAPLVRPAGPGAAASAAATWADPSAVPTTVPAAAQQRVRRLWAAARAEAAAALAAAAPVGAQIKLPSSQPPNAARRTAPAAVQAPAAAEARSRVLPTRPLITEQLPSQPFHPRSHAENVLADADTSASDHSARTSYANSSTVAADSRMPPHFYGPETRARTSTAARRPSSAMAADAALGAWAGARARAVESQFSLHAGARRIVEARVRAHRASAAAKAAADAAAAEAEAAAAHERALRRLRAPAAEPPTQLALMPPPEDGELRADALKRQAAALRAAAAATAAAAAERLAAEQPSAASEDRSPEMDPDALAAARHHEAAVAAAQQHQQRMVASFSHTYLLNPGPSRAQPAAAGQAAGALATSLSSHVLLPDSETVAAAAASAVAASATLTDTFAAAQLALRPAELTIVKRHVLTRGHALSPPELPETTHSQSFLDAASPLVHAHFGSGRPALNEA